jgi:hypothetical protein
VFLDQDRLRSFMFFYGVSGGFLAGNEHPAGDVKPSARRALQHFDGGRSSKTYLS